MNKPQRIFDRTREWSGLASFATRSTEATQGGASLGVVSGRRRQGKSFLLQAATEAAEGLYFAATEATEATEAESLRLFADALSRHTREFVEPLRDWNDAISRMFRSISDRPTIVAIDEFPFLSKTITRAALPSSSANSAQEAAAARVRHDCCCADRRCR